MKESLKITTLHYVLSILIVIFSFLHFLYSDISGTLLPPPTAFEWPAIDMMVYFERALDPHFLLNDFFTNTSHELSPRIIFGELIISLSQLFKTNYYTIFYLLKAFIKISLPVIFYFFLCAIPMDFKSNLRRIYIKNILLFPWALFAGTWWAAATFSVGNWRPLPIWAAPQSLGLLLSLFGGLGWLSYRMSFNLIGTGFIFAGTLIHPAMGIFTALFLILSANTKKQFITFLILTLTSMGSATFVLQHYFSTPFQLPAPLFIQHYVIEPYIHRAHYAPDSFGSYGNMTWHEIFKMNVFLLSIGFIFALFKKNYRIAQLAVIYIISYASAVALQIIGTDFFPSRTITILGPIRFTQFGYAMLAVISSACITLLIARFSFLDTYLLRWEKRKSQGLALLLTTILSLTFLSLLWKDDPKKMLYQHHSLMYQWISQHTHPNDVFAVPLSDSELFISIPIVSKRAVYYANAIAFSDQHLAENTLRKNFLYGSYKEWDEGGPGGFYCHLLTTQRLRVASQKYPLQWVIMPNHCLKDKNFNGLEIKFKDNSLSILKVH